MNLLGNVGAVSVTSFKMAAGKKKQKNKVHPCFDIMVVWFAEELTRKISLVPWTTCNVLHINFFIQQKSNLHASRFYLIRHTFRKSM